MIQICGKNIIVTPAASCALAAIILCSAPAAGAAGMVGGMGDCTPAFTVSARVESNDNIYEGYVEHESDSINNYGFLGEYECEDEDSGLDFTLSFGYDKFEFEENKIEDYQETEVAFELEKVISSRDWVEIAAERNRLNTEYVEALYEYPGDDREVSLTYGRSLNSRAIGEITFSLGRNEYDTLSSSNSKSRSWKAKYTYTLKEYTYLELSYEREISEYPNDFLYVYSPSEQTIVDSGVNREDTATTFAVSLTKTIQIYPLRYLQLAVESTDSDSTDNDIDFYEPDKLIEGVDNYDDFNYSAYYIHDLNEKSTLILYYLYDVIDYPNYQVINDDYTYGGTLSVRMKYYYGLVQYYVSEQSTLELAGTLVRSTSNSTSMTYNQRIYSLGISVDF